MTIKVTVNGDPMELLEGIKITELLGQLKLKPELVVVEHNLNILRREELAKAQLQEGDQVEIVHFVGGGSGMRMEKTLKVLNDLEGQGVIEKYAIGQKTTG